MLARTAITLATLAAIAVPALAAEFHVSTDHAQQIANRKVSRDPDVTTAWQAIQGIRGIGNEAEYQQVRERYLRHCQYLGRVNVKVRRARQAAQLANDQQKKVFQQMAANSQMDQKTMTNYEQVRQQNHQFYVSAVGPSAWALSQAYQREQTNLANSGNKVFGLMIRFIANSPRIPDSEGQKLLQDSAYVRQKAEQELAEAGPVDVFMREVSHKVLMPIFEGASQGSPAESPVDAMAGVIEALGNILQHNSGR